MSNWSVCMSVLHLLLLLVPNNMTAIDGDNDYY